MQKTLIAILTGATVMGFAGTANATQCITKYLTGVWVGTETGNTDDAYCVVQFKSNGWVIQASCFDRDTLKSEGTWDGRFTTDKACNVSGNFDFLPTKGKKVDIEFKGTLNPNTGVMTGTMKSKGQAAVDYTLVEQWN